MYISDDSPRLSAMNDLQSAVQLFIFVRRVPLHLHGQLDVVTLLFSRGDWWKVGLCGARAQKPARSQNAALSSFWVRPSWGVWLFLCSRRPFLISSRFVSAEGRKLPRNRPPSAPVPPKFRSVPPLNSRRVPFNCLRVVWGEISATADLRKLLWGVRCPVPSVHPNSLSVVKYLILDAASGHFYTSLCLLLKRLRPFSAAIHIIITYYI